MVACYATRMIIAVINSKGGVGKTTIAVHLAVWLRKQGYIVALADCDTQRSSSQWILEAAPDISTLHFDDPEAILEQLPAMAREVDFLIADGPGSNSEVSRSILLRADITIMPCKASILEARALDGATKILRLIQDVRKGKPRAVAVLSMVGKQYRLTQDMRDTAEALGLPLARTSLVLRQSYADAPGQGTVVWNMGARAGEARLEVERLFEELFPEAVGGHLNMEAVAG